MSQITIYLDDQCEQSLRSAAAADGIPVSRWVVGAIEEKVRNNWPAGVRELAGSWAIDFPDAEALRQQPSQDAEREVL